MRKGTARIRPPKRSFDRAGNAVQPLHLRVADRNRVTASTSLSVQEDARRTDFTLRTISSRSARYVDLLRTLISNSAPRYGVKRNVASSVSPVLTVARGEGIRLQLIPRANQSCRGHRFTLGQSFIWVKVVRTRDSLTLSLGFHVELYLRNIPTQRSARQASDSGAGPVWAETQYPRTAPGVEL